MEATLKISFKNWLKKIILKDCWAPFKSDHKDFVHPFLTINKTNPILYTRDNLSDESAQRNQKQFCQLESWWQLFFGNVAYIHWLLLKKEKSDNKRILCSVIELIAWQNQEETSSFDKKKVPFHHDIALVQICSCHGNIAWLNFQIVAMCTCSANVASCDFYQFPKLKKLLLKEIYFEFWTIL